MDFLPVPEENDGGDSEDEMVLSQTRIDRDIDPEGVDGNTFGLRLADNLCDDRFCGFTGGAAGGEEIEDQKTCRSKCFSQLILVDGFHV